MKEPTEEDYYDELLSTSRTKIELGDTFASVFSFLKSRNADEETMRQIISILNEEDRARRKKAAPAIARTAKITGFFSGLFYIAGGLLVLIISWLVLDEGLMVGRIFFLPVIGMVIGGGVAIKGVFQMVAPLLKKE